MRLIVAALLFAVSATAADLIVVPRFADPDRRTKLESAFPEVERIFDKYRDERGIPGLVFGIVVDGDLAYVKGIGVRERTSSDPVTADTVFRIASMTKSFTALAVLKLRDERRLSLDDPAAKWIPELSRSRPPTRDSAPITIRHLLTHSAGFPEDNPWGDRQLAASDASLTRWLMAGLPFSTPPGTSYEYSNYGFALLGRIVAKSSGMPYRRYLEKQILGPLGMTASTLDPFAVPASVRAAGYRKSGGAYGEETPLPDGAFGAMGGLLTSARDMGRYLAYMLSAWPPRDEADRGPVRRASLREMQQAWRPSDFTVARRSPEDMVNAAAGAYGYGLRIRQDCRFDHYVGHGGGLPGFGSWMGWLPSYGVGIFVMANLTYAGPSAAVDEALEVLRKTGGLKPRELPPSPALVATREATLRLWERWDDREAGAIAADNLFLDTPAAEYRSMMDGLKAKLGSCRAASAVEPLNLLRGSYRMTCERGHVDISFTLAPTNPPRVQDLEFTSAMALEGRAENAANALASLVGSFREDGLASIAGRALDQDKTRRQLESLRAHYGSCRLGATLAGDGRTDVRVRFDCDRGSLDVSLRFEENGGIRSARFTRDPATPCVP